MSSLTLNDMEQQIIASGVIEGMAYEARHVEGKEMLISISCDGALRGSRLIEVYRKALKAIDEQILARSGMPR